MNVLVLYLDCMLCYIYTYFAVSVKFHNAHKMYFVSDQHEMLISKSTVVYQTLAYPILLFIAINLKNENNYKQTLLITIK